MASVIGARPATAYGYFVEDTAAPAGRTGRGVRGRRPAGRRRLPGAAGGQGPGQGRDPVPRSSGSVRPCRLGPGHPGGRRLAHLRGDRHRSGRGRPDRPARAAYASTTCADGPGTTEPPSRRLGGSWSTACRSYQISDGCGLRIPVVRQRLGRLDGALHRNELRRTPTLPRSRPSRRARGRPAHRWPGADGPRGWPAPCPARRCRGTTWRPWSTRPAPTPRRPARRSWMSPSNMLGSGSCSDAVGAGHLEQDPRHRGVEAQQHGERLTAARTAPGSRSALGTVTANSSPAFGPAMDHRAVSRALEPTAATDSTGPNICTSAVR